MIRRPFGAVIIIAVLALTGCSVNDGPTTKPSPASWSDSTFQKVNVFQPRVGKGYVAEAFIIGEPMEKLDSYMIYPPQVVEVSGHRHKLPEEAVHSNGTAYPIRIYHLVTKDGKTIDTATCD